MKTDHAPLFSLRSFFFSSCFINMSSFLLDVIVSRWPSFSALCFSKARVRLFSAFTVQFHRTHYSPPPRHAVYFRPLGLAFDFRARLITGLPLPRLPRAPHASLDLPPVMFDFHGAPRLTGRRGSDESGPLCCSNDGLSRPGTLAAFPSAFPCNHCFACPPPHPFVTPCLWYRVSRLTSSAVRLPFYTKPSFPPDSVLFLFFPPLARKLLPLGRDARRRDSVPVSSRSATHSEV